MTNRAESGFPPFRGRSDCGDTTPTLAAGPGMMQFVCHVEQITGWVPWVTEEGSLKIKYKETILAYQPWSSFGLPTLKSTEEAKCASQQHLENNAANCVFWAKALILF